MEPPFIDRWRRAVKLDVTVVKILGETNRVLFRPAGSGHVVGKRAAFVIRLRESGGRHARCRISIANSDDKIVIHNCVIDWPGAYLIGFIANYIKATGIGPGERANVVVYVPCPLSFLPCVECEILRFDRTGAVALRPRDEVLVVRNSQITGDRPKLGPCRLLIGAPGHENTKKDCWNHRGPDHIRPQ